MEGRFQRFWPLPLRLMMGAAFLFHGIPKLSATGQAAIERTIGAIGFPAPAFFGWVVALVEVLGGAGLVLGLLTPVAAFFLSIDMLVAIFAVHLRAGFPFVNVVGMGPNGPVFGMPGFEAPLLYLVALVALFIGGPGPLSVDEGVAGWRERFHPPWWRRAPAHA